MKLLKEWKKSGRDLDQSNGDGTTPLIMAALGGQFEVAKYLVENKANVNAMSRDRNAVIHSAAFLGRLEIVRLLVEHGANVHVKNGDGATAVQIASQEFSEVADFMKMVDRMLDLDLDLKKDQIFCQFYCCELKLPHAEQILRQIFCIFSLK